MRTNKVAKERYRVYGMIFKEKGEVQIFVAGIPAQRQTRTGHQHFIRGGLALILPAFHIPSSKT